MDTSQRKQRDSVGKLLRNKSCKQIEWRWRKPSDAIWSVVACSQEHERRFTREQCRRPPTVSRGRELPPRRGCTVRRQWLAALELLLPHYDVKRFWDKGRLGLSSLRGVRARKTRGNASLLSRGWVLLPSLCINGCTVRAHRQCVQTCKIGALKLMVIHKEHAQAHKRMHTSAKRSSYAVLAQNSITSLQENATNIARSYLCFILPAAK